MIPSGERQWPDAPMKHNDAVNHGTRLGWQGQLGYRIDDLEDEVK